MTGESDDRCEACDGTRPARAARGTPVPHRKTGACCAAARSVGDAVGGGTRFSMDSRQGWKYLACAGSIMKQLSGLDNVFLQLERGNQHMHVAGLAIYDPSSAAEGRVRFRDVLRFYGGIGI